MKHMDDIRPNKKRTIIFTNDLEFLKNYSSKVPVSGAFFILRHNGDFDRIKGLLSDSLKLKEVTKKDVHSRIGESFKKEFSRIMYDLNKENGSEEWWAMSFTNKYPLMSELYENIFCFIAAKMILFDFRNPGLVLVSDSAALAKQLRAWSKKSGIRFISKLSPRLDIKEFLSERIPILIFIRFAKLFFRKIIILSLFGTRYPKGPKERIIVTQFEDRAVGESGIFRDIYFGDLAFLLENNFEHMKASSFLTVGFSPYNGFTGLIRKIAKNRQDADIRPFEYFLKFRELAWALLIAVARFARKTKIKGKFSIFGDDVSILLKEEISRSISSGQSLLNICVYYSALSLSKAFGAKALYYPFENRSWEKMVVMAFRKNSPATKLVGYQHTVVTPKTLCYFLEEGEYSSIPSPDIIITDGEITNRIMRTWNIPQNILKTGCALRSISTEGSGAAPGGRINIKNILVALASSADEYVKMLMFLEDALAPESTYDLVIRPHPAVPIDAAFRIFKPSRLKYRLSGSMLKDDLAWCDAVLYAASAVSLDAVSMGKPVIHVELDDFLDPDPLFYADILKWRCDDPRKLTTVFEYISGLDENEVKRMRIEAADYAKKYFYSINKTNLAQFLIGEGSAQRSANI